jgi:hypothetical protein
MSFDVFLMSFGETEKIGLPRESIRALFPIAVKISNADSWFVLYDKENTSRIDVKAHPTNNEALIRLAVQRPCGDIRFWQSLLEILKMGEVFMVWPGGRPVVATVKNAALLPDGLDALGQPRVAESAEQLLAFIKDS